MPFDGSGNYVVPAGTAGVPNTVIDSTKYNTLLSDLQTALTLCVTRNGQSAAQANLPMGGFKLTGLAAGLAAGDSLRWEQLFAQGAETAIASAATLDIGAVNSSFLRVTGSTGPITSLGTNYNGPRFLRFIDTPTLTHNASTLILPTGANIIAAAGDTCIAIPKATSTNPDGWAVLAYQRATGGPLLTCVIPAQLQGQTYTAFTTAGTATAYTLTPAPAISAYAENQEFDVEFNAASTGTPTLDISGLGAKSLKFRGPTGALVSVGTRIPSGWRSKVTYDGADMIVREMPPAPSFYFGNGWINAGSFNSSSFTSLYVATTSVSNNSGFSSGTVTVPYSGWYEVICPRMSYSYISGTVTSVDFRVGHNGSNINPEFSLTADTQRMAFHVVFAVTAGDTVEFRGRVTGGGTVGYSLVGVQMRMLS